MSCVWISRAGITLAMSGQSRLDQYAAGHVRQRRVCTTGKHPAQPGLCTLCEEETGLNIMLVGERKFAEN